MKTKNYNAALFCLLFFTPLACLKDATRKTIQPEALICGLPVTESFGIEILEPTTVSQLRLTDFPASFMLGCVDRTIGHDCVFEISGPKIQKDQIFFRHGQQVVGQSFAEDISTNKVRVTYKIQRGSSYGIVSIEPKLDAPANHFGWTQNQLSFSIENGSLLRQEKGLARVRSLGPQTTIKMENSSAQDQKFVFELDNVSTRLSKLPQEIEHGSLSITEVAPLTYRVEGIVHKNKTSVFSLTPQKLPRPYSFLFGGDIKREIETFSKLLAEAKKKSDPLFFIGVGDYTRNSLPREVATYFEKTKDLAIPIYYVKGNHESRCQGDTWYRMYFGPERYTLRIEDSLFVIFDTNLRRYEGFIIEPEQFSWLENVLEKNQDVPWKFLISHAPPFPLHRAYNLIAEDAARIISIAEKHRLAYVLFGHAHLFARRELNGVVYLASGGGGAKLYDYNPVEGFTFDSRKHLTLFRVNTTGIEEEILHLP
jgi:predicted phosphodiesterase